MGPSETNCVSCIIGLQSVSIVGSQVKCVPCEEITGYFTSTNSGTNQKSCTEICGDGLNLGQHECDDGNTEDGDGCSKDCKLETGFVCKGGNATEKDSCINITPPTLEMSPLFLNNIYIFYFSEPLKIISTRDPKDYVALAIIGDLAPYEFDYEVTFEKENTVFGRGMELITTDTGDLQFYKTIVITLEPLSSIMENDVIYSVYIYRNSILFSHPVFSLIMMIIFYIEWKSQLIYINLNILILV